MFKVFWTTALWIMAAAWAAAAGVGEGMTREEVEAEVGKPLSVLMRGDTTVMRYPNDGRVELREGRVTRVVRVRHVSDGLTPEELAALEAAKLAKAEAEAEKAEEAKAKEEALAAAAAEADWMKASADGRKEMEAAVEQLSESPTPVAGAGGPADAMGFRESPSHFWTMLGVGALVQVGVGMVVLKLAFRWADVHADWVQMLWPALAGMAGVVVVRAVGYAGWGVTEFFRMDDAVSYVALLTALLKTTHACTWQRALAVASAAKLMTIVVWTFLGVALAHVLFA